MVFKIINANRTAAIGHGVDKFPKHETDIRMHSKRVFCCLDIYKTRNFSFTLSQNEKKSIYQLRSL
jgi:hypothetical protein